MNFTLIFSPAEQLPEDLSLGPGAEDPVAEDPATENPAAKDPATENPVAEDSAAKDPAAEDLPFLEVFQIPNNPAYSPGSAHYHDLDYSLPTAHQPAPSQPAPSQPALSQPAVSAGAPATLSAVKQQSPLLTRNTLHKFRVRICLWKATHHLKVAKPIFKLTRCKDLGRKLQRSKLARRKLARRQPSPTTKPHH